MAAIGLSTQRNSKDGLADWVACCLGRGEYAPLAREDAEELASVLTEELLAAGAPIISQGERPENVMIVREGEVALYRRARGRNLMLSVLRPGEVLADIPLISRMPMLYTARTMTPARILHLRREDFERLLTARPSIALRWLQSAAQRMEGTQRRLLEVLGEDLQSQLCMLLLDRADNGRVSLSQQTLADLVGAQRSSVNRVLKSLQRQGLIFVAYREIDILDPEGLESRTSLGSFVVPGRRFDSDPLKKTVL